MIFSHLQGTKKGAVLVYRYRGGIPIVFISKHGVVTQFVSVSFLCVPVHEDTTQKSSKFG